MKRLVTCLAGLLVLLGISLNATTVIVLSSRDEILLAVDSKVSTADSSLSHTGCKLVVTRNAAYGLAGIAGVEAGALDSGNTHINLMAEIAKVATDDVQGTLDALEPLAVKLVDRARSTLGPAKTAEYYNGKDPAVRIVGVGNSPGLSMRVRNFYMRATVTDIERLRTVPPNVSIYSSSKGVDAAARVLKRLEKERLKPVQMLFEVRAAMRAGIEADLAKSGLPISIVRLTRMGTTWIERGACEAPK